MLIRTGMNPGNQSKVYRNLSVIFNCIHLMKFMKFSMLICDTRGDLKTRQMSLPAFLFSYILQCICFKILLTESRYFISNWNYPRLSHKCFLYPNKQCLHDATHLIKGCLTCLVSSVLILINMLLIGFISWMFFPIYWFILSWNTHLWMVTISQIIGWFQTSILFITWRGAYQYSE